MRGYDPIALVGKYGDDTAGGIGKLPATMGVQRKVLAVCIVIGRDHCVTGDVLVGIDVSFAHGPNLMIYDLIVQAGLGSKCS